MKPPRNPLSKESHKHFADKIKRGEKFTSKSEKEKMVKRCEMFDRGYKDKHGKQVEYGE